MNMYRSYINNARCNFPFLPRSMLNFHLTTEFTNRASFISVFAGNFWTIKHSIDPDQTERSLIQFFVPTPETFRSYLRSWYRNGIFKFERVRRAYVAGNKSRWLIEGKACSLNLSRFISTTMNFKIPLPPSTRMRILFRSVAGRELKNFTKYRRCF